MICCGPEICVIFYRTRANRVYLDPPADVFTQRGCGMQRGDAYRLFLVGRFDDKKAAHHLLGFGIRPVRHDGFAAARAHAEGGFRPLERAAPDELAGLLESRVPGGQGLYQRLHVGGRHGVHFFGVVIGQAEVLHEISFVGSAE